MTNYGIKYIIASRPDLLGGKLIALLNGLRLGRRLGLPFLYTWEIQRPDVLSVPSTYFADEFAASFSTETGEGFVVSSDFMDSLRLSSKVSVVETNGRETTVVRVDPVQLDNADAFICDERFAIYLLPGETKEAVYAELAELAREIRLNAKIESALHLLDSVMPERSVGLHVRRMDIVQFRLRYESMLSYVPDGYLESVLLNQPWGSRLVVCSDDVGVVERLSRLRPSAVLHSSQLAEEHGLNAYQAAFFDIISLSRCSTIFAGRSAFSAVAALMGNCELVDIRNGVLNGRLPLPIDSLSQSFYFFDLGRLRLEGDPTESVGSFRLAMQLDELNFCCRFSFVDALAHMQNGDAAGAAADAVNRFIRDHARREEVVDGAGLLVLLRSVVCTDVNASAGFSIIESAIASVWRHRAFDVSVLIESRAKFDAIDGRLRSSMYFLSILIESCLYELAGDLNAAVDLLKCVDLDFEFYDLFILRLSWLSLQLLRLPDALFYGRLATFRNPTNPAAAFELSIIYDRIGYNSSAYIEAKRAVGLDPTDALHWHHAGNMCMRLQKAEEAFRFYDQAIKMDSSKLIYWARICPIYAHNRQFDKLTVALARLLRGSFVEHGYVGNLGQFLPKENVPEEVFRLISSLHSLELNNI